MNLRGRAWIAVLTIVLAVLAAYANTVRVPFQFDDVKAIVDNPTIRRLWPPGIPLSPPADGSGVHGRPLVNLSLAINYALSGEDPGSYHVLNAGLHALSACLLFGIVRRSWPLSSSEYALQQRGLPLTGGSMAGFLVALLWAVHPLQSESVTCIIQRTELLVSLFYLLTLYLFVRGVDSPHPRRWFVACVAASLAGMASKEVMVTAPVVVLLYDRTFAAGSFAEAWRKRWPVHLGLASTWLLLAVLVMDSPQRGGTAGFGLGISSWSYLLTQSYAIMLYLKLAIWPHPLVVDYGSWTAAGLTAVWPQATAVVVLLAGAVVALRFFPRAGFLGAWFFMILAPSSSVVPLATQTMAEHRMYLPLAAVVIAMVLGLARVARGATPVLALLLATGATAMTVQRNRTYASDLSLWTQTVAARPENFRAHNSLGTALVAAGRLPAAIAEYEEALRLEPNYAAVQRNLCGALLKAGRIQEAVEHGQIAVRLNPANADAQNNLANGLFALGATQEAIAHYAAAVRIEPDAPDLHLNLAAALMKANAVSDAVVHYKAAAQLQPERAQTWNDLARALDQSGDSGSAYSAVHRALQLQPEFPEACFVLGNLEAEQGHLAAAVSQFRRALTLSPDYLEARNNLANALLLSGQVDEAIEHYREILRRNPGERSVQENLERALALQRSQPTEP